ncbi:hypothetical protein [Photobacterium damselae]|uniref:hypothetical protein n=1 Tax=Photobacterium damselae TaxID=38293 RepID=UPI000A745132|nr:hypothetical protein [Photobacterium damselae]ELV7517801.1 hypothetical protein [Photobacterium damselae]WIH21288.1 hypothetical protein KQY33_19610 [Photobacterium damselae]
MTRYYVNQNAQANGDHEVHSENCPYLSQIHKKGYLGCFEYCGDAVIEAKKYYPKANGCVHCSTLCHTS